MNPSERDWDIIQRVLDGDVESFEEIVLLYQTKVLKLCCALLGPTDAEDAAQDIFIKVYESLSQFKGLSSFSTWLYRISSNHCLNLIARRNKLKLVPLDTLLERADSKKPPSLEEKEIVQWVLSQMKPEERVLLTLRELEGLEYQDLSETLNISLDLVRVRLFRARKSFLKILKKQEASQQTL